MFVRKNFCESCEQYHGYTPTEGFCTKQQCARFNTDEAPVSCFEQSEFQRQRGKSNEQ